MPRKNRSRLGDISKNDEHPELSNLSDIDLLSDKRPRKGNFLEQIMGSRATSPVTSRAPSPGPSRAPSTSITVSLLGRPEASYDFGTDQNIAGASRPSPGFSMASSTSITVSLQGRPEASFGFDMEEHIPNILPTRRINSNTDSGESFRGPTKDPPNQPYVRSSSRRRLPEANHNFGMNGPPILRINGDSIQDLAKDPTNQLYVVSESTTQRSVVVGLGGSSEADFDLDLAGLFEDSETIQDGVKDPANQTSAASSPTQNSKANHKSGTKQRVTKAPPKRTANSNAYSGNFLEVLAKGSANVVSSATQRSTVADLEESSEADFDFDLAGLFEDSEDQSDTASFVTQSSVVAGLEGSSEADNDLGPAELSEDSEDQSDTASFVTQSSVVAGLEGSSEANNDFGPAELSEDSETIEDHVEDPVNQESVASSAAQSSDWNQNSDALEQHVTDALSTRTTRSNADNGDSVEDLAKDPAVQASVASSTTPSSKANYKFGGTKQRVIKARPTRMRKSNSDGDNPVKDLAKSSVNQAHIVSSATQSSVVAGLEGVSEDRHESNKQDTPGAEQNVPNALSPDSRLTNSNADTIQGDVKGPTKGVYAVSTSTTQSSVLVGLRGRPEERHDSSMGPGQHTTNVPPTKTIVSTADSGTNSIQDLIANAQKPLQINAQTVQVIHVYQTQTIYGNNYQDYVKHGDTYAGAITNGTVGGRENSNQVVNHGPLNQGGPSAKKPGPSRRGSL